MIFSGLFLLGEIPFTDVIITSTVMAVDGRRMSKSLGTGIDPLEAVRKHGADATRYGLLKMSSAQDPRFSWGNIEEGAKLANKLWNVSRLILQRGRRRIADGSSRRRSRSAGSCGGSRRRAPRSRRRCPRRGSTSRRSSNALYHLVFDDFCDWYAEAIKPRLYAGDEAARRDRARRARAPARAAPSRDAARHRGDLVAVPRHAADRLAVAGARRHRRRRPRARPRPAGGRDLPAERRARAARRRGEAHLRRGRQAGARAARTATSMPSVRGCARRSRAPRACSRTSASSRTHRPSSSTPSARSSSASVATSRRSPASVRAICRHGTCVRRPV